MRDFGRALGQDSDAYLKEPMPGAGLPKILAEEALSTIMQNALPRGRPQEGAAAHMKSLTEFFGSDDFGLLTPPQVELFKQYLVATQENMAQEAQQQQLLQAAASFQVGGNEPGGRPAENAPNMANPPVNNELLDETLIEGGTQ